MSNIITIKEFAISKEIVATETDGGELHLVNEQSKENVELVDFEAWLASYLDSDIVFSNVLEKENYTVMGDDEEGCQSFFDSLDALILAGKDKRHSRR